MHIIFTLKLKSYSYIDIVIEVFESQICINLTRKLIINHLLLVCSMHCIVT